MAADKGRQTITIVIPGLIHPLPIIVIGVAVFAIDGSIDSLGVAQGNPQRRVAADTHGSGQHYRVPTRTAAGVCGTVLLGPRRGVAAAVHLYRVCARKGKENYLVQIVKGGYHVIGELDAPFSNCGTAIIVTCAGIVDIIVFPIQRTFLGKTSRVGLATSRGPYVAWIVTVAVAPALEEIACSRGGRQHYHVAIVVVGAAAADCAMAGIVRDGGHGGGAVLGRYGGHGLYADDGAVVVIVGVCRAGSSAAIARTQRAYGVVSVGQTAPAPVHVEQSFAVVSVQHKGMASTILAVSRIEHWSAGIKLHLQLVFPFCVRKA